MDAGNLCCNSLSLSRIVLFTKYVWIAITNRINCSLINKIFPTFLKTGKCDLSLPACASSSEIFLPGLEMTSLLYPLLGINVLFGGHTKQFSRAIHESLLGVLFSVELRFSRNNELRTSACKICTLTPKVPYSLTFLHIFFCLSIHSSNLSMYMCLFGVTFDCAQERAMPWLINFWHCSWGIIVTIEIIPRLVSCDASNLPIKI